MLNSPLILVLGHDSCGAIDATIKSLKDNTTLPGHLPSLVNALSPSVKAAADQPGDKLANAIRQNVKDVTAKLKSATPIISAAAATEKSRSSAAFTGWQAARSNWSIDGGGHTHAVRVGRAKRNPPLESRVRHGGFRCALPTLQISRSNLQHLAQMFGADAQLLQPRQIVEHAPLLGNAAVGDPKIDIS